MAREVKADVVMVGHRKQGLLARWWSGSNNDYLTDHVGCSVLVSCNVISDAVFEAELKKAEAERAAAAPG